MTMISLIDQHRNKSSPRGKMNTIHIAKLMMQLFEYHPQYSEIGVGELNEIFNHKCFIDADESKRNTMRLRSSESKYNSEVQYPWDNYFGFDLFPFLKGKTALDLGCFTGGKSVAWFERYKLQKITGIDIKDVYIDAAVQFADKHNVNADFKVCFGESLPFEDDTFDAILSFDVFEHVQNVQRTLHECYRVLKTGGRLFIVFPSYYHPKETHLNLVTKTPCIHWFFRGETLIRAYYDILEERGDDASWYKRSSPCLESWERGNTLNGTTLSQFKKLIGNMHWRSVRQINKPVGSVGRNISHNKVIKKISMLFFPLTFLPGIRELLLHRITFILEK